MQEHAHIPPHDEEKFFDEELARLKAEADEEAIDEPHDYILHDDFPRVPRELKRLDQWVNWQQDEERKIPLNPRTLRNAGVGYENTWSTYGFAAAVASRENLGIGFVLTEQDPYTCVDLDKVIEERELKPYGREILDSMQGYVELSPSGNGLHVWVQSRESFNRRTQGIEVYSDHRWMTVTGRANPRVPTEIPDRTEEVKHMIDERFPKQEMTVFARPQTIEEDDAALWQRLFSTKNGNFLQALYDGDLSVVKDDHSRGVIMLANMLAVYTYSDAKRMESLLRQTNLINDKWYEKRGKLTWIEFQIQDAIEFVHRRETTRQTRDQKTHNAEPVRTEDKPSKNRRTDAKSAGTLEPSKTGKPRAQRRSVQAGTKETSGGGKTRKKTTKRKPPGE